MLPQAPSSDTTGWFARDAETFAQVSSVLLGEATGAALPTRLLIAVDAFGFADPEVAAALQPMVERLAAADRLSRGTRSWRRRASRSGRGRSAPCSLSRPGTPSGPGSTRQSALRLQRRPRV